MEVGKKKKKSSKKVEDKIDLAVLKKSKGGKKGDAQCITHVPRFIYEGLLLTFLIYFKFYVINHVISLNSNRYGLHSL